MTNPQFFGEQVIEVIRAKTISPKILDLLSAEKKVTLGFSGGKDSLCCAVLLKSLNVDFIPFYFYLCPELDFVEKTLTMYERVLGIQIVRMPHPIIYDFYRHQDFQPPKMIEYMGAFDFPKLTFENIIDMHLAYIGDTRQYYDVVGVRASESFNRRKQMEKSGAINHEKKKIFLIHDWNKSDVLAYLAEKKIPLSDDYAIWNRSYDGMKYQFLFGVKKHYPNDYKKLLEYFPLLEAELFRYEQNKKYF